MFDIAPAYCQDLEFEATARLGVGKSHAKFAPGIAWYSFMPKLTINQKKAAELKDKYPVQIFGKDGTVIKDLANHPNLVDACAGVDDAIKVEYDESTFLFFVESWGQLGCKEIVKTASEQFTKKLDELNSLVGKL